MGADKLVSANAHHFRAERRTSGRFTLDEPMQRLLHELRARQAELERENEMLRKMQDELEAGRARYSELYEFSPVASFTFGRSGVIEQSNRAGASLLMLKPARVPGKRFGTLLVPADLHVFNTFLARVFAARPHPSCELRLPREDAQPRVVRIEGRLSSDGLSCHAVVTDVTERAQIEMQASHRNHVLEMLAANRPLIEVLDTIAREVEARNPDLLCTSLLFKSAVRTARHSVTPGPPAPQDHVSDDEIGSGVCAAERVVVGGVGIDPWCASPVKLGARIGLGTSWSQPIRSGQDWLLGAFTIYHTQAFQPSTADLQLIEDEARLAALAIEKSSANERMQLAERAFSHASEGILVTDANGTIVEVNAAFTRITGYSREEALGQNPRILKSSREGPEFYAEMQAELIKTGHWCGELWNRRKSGEVYAELTTISAVHDENGQLRNYVALFSDVTKMKEQQQQLERIAHYDSLTKLPNRLMLNDRLQQAMVRSQRHGDSVAVAYLDLDGFKAVNDEYGHHVGDEVLITLTQRMKAALREGDTLARVGGDEFVAVLVDIKQFSDCEPVLERLLLAASHPVESGGVVLHVSASIGVTLYPQDAVEMDQLMRHSDQAMYQAKQSGRNHYRVFHVDRDEA